MIYDVVRQEMKTNARTRKLMQGIAGSSASDLRVICLGALADKPVEKVAQLLGYSPESTSLILRVYLDGIATVLKETRTT